MTQRRFPDDSLACSVLGLVWVWSGSGSGTGLGSGLGLGPCLVLSGLYLGIITQWPPGISTCVPSPEVTELTDGTDGRRWRRWR